MSMDPVPVEPAPVPAVSAGAIDYPLTLAIQYPESLSRLLLLVKWLLVIPQLLILYALGAVNSVISLIAFFAILFTKKYPRGLFDLYVNITRWTVNVYAYWPFYMRNEYPPFSWDEGKYAVTYEVPYPEELKRFAPLYKWILAIPHYIVLMVIWLIALIIVFIAWFAILFTGKYPRGMFEFVEGTFRWSYRVNNYVYFLRDEYPPFSLK